MDATEEREDVDYSGDDSSAVSCSSTPTSTFPDPKSDFDTVGGVGAANHPSDATSSKYRYI